MNKKKIKALLQILGPLIFIYILFQIDYQLLFQEVKLLKWPLLFFSLLLMILEIVIRSLRWQVLLSALNIAITKIESISLYWLGVFIGIITPGRIGEVIKIYFLKSRGYSAFRSLFSVILDRIVDIVVLLCLGFLAAFFFLRQISFYVAIIGAVLILGIVFVFMLINPDSFLHKLFGKIIQKIIPVNFNDYNRFTFKKFWQGIKGLKKKEVFGFIIYLVIGWLLYFFSRYVVAGAMGLDLSFLDIAIVSVLSAVVSILPISIAGIGTREATIIYVFGLFGINKEAAVLFSLLIFTVNILAVAFGFIPYLKESNLVNRAKKD